MAALHQAHSGQLALPPAAPPAAPPADPRQLAAKTADMESDLWKERLMVSEIAETTAEMKRTGQNLRETDRRAHKAEGPKPKRIHSEPVKPQSVWSVVSAGPPALLFYPPAKVLPGESCNDHENGLVDKDEGQLDAATKAESQARPRNGT